MDTLLTETSSITPITSTTASEFLGMSKHRAQDLAEYRSFVFRLVSIDGEKYLGYPEDVRTDRVCVEIVNGKITIALMR
jgi:hypothetical protein